MDRVHAYYRRIIEVKADYYRQFFWGQKIDANLLEAIVMKESSGHADAFRFEPGYYRRYIKGKPEWDRWVPRRVASSYGLMQIMYPTALQNGFSSGRVPEELFIPDMNLDYGIKHLGYLLVWSQTNLTQALAAYNGGKGNWDAEVPLAYAASVLRKYRALQALPPA